MSRKPQARPPGPGAASDKGSGLALAALILGMAALIPVLGVALAAAAVGCGIVALARGTAARGMAVAGITLAVFGIVEAPAMILLVRIPARQAERSRCAANLTDIGRGYLLYETAHRVPPPDAETLIAAGTDERLFRCPSARAGRARDYFYRPPPPGADAKTLVACDLRGNHPGGRNVLDRTGSVRWLSDGDFRAELALPRNARFAAALRKAEAARPSK